MRASWVGTHAEAPHDRGRAEGGGIVDETLNPEARSEHRDMAVVGSLSMRAFPALEELTFTFKSADEVAQFFFAWTAFVFYKKVA